MSRVSNKKIEKYYFEMFRQVYPLPPGNVEHGDKPDVIIDGPKKIGIEMTNFYLEEGNLRESEQVQRSLRKSIVSNAQQLYLNNEGRNITITFSFDKTKPIRDRRELERKLAEYAKSIENLGKGAVPKETFKAIPELFYVYLNPKEYTDAKWQVPPVYEGQIMSRARLQEIVKTKDKKLSKYRKCDAYWLLVVVNFMDGAQDQEIRVEDFGEIKSEKFEKILVYKTVFGHIFEVK
ncbi:MAG: hypothetical protein IH886_17255 [Nitrospinae bacterium]|nr:hypothetical protein [Nitrospinota bacterium]